MIGPDHYSWFGLVWFGLVWFGLFWFGWVRFGSVWFGLVWFGFAGKIQMQDLNINVYIMERFR